MFFFARSPSWRDAARAALVHGAGLAILLQVHGCAGATARSTCAAWSCGGASNDELVDRLRAGGLLRNAAVEAAMRQVDRADYAPRAPYDDTPQAIGHAATISAPHMHAHALELLHEPLSRAPRGAKVLDVGCGSGYLLAVLARLVRDDGAGGGGGGGRVFGVDVVPQLVELAERNLRKRDAALLDGRVVTLHTGDGWRGLAAEGPFDAIHVGAAAARVPEALVAQLKPGGRMLCPVGPAGGTQRFLRIDVDAEGRAHTEALFAVRYVPLVETA